MYRSAINKLMQVEPFESENGAFCMENAEWKRSKLSNRKRCFSLFGAVQRKNRNNIHAPKMMSPVKVTFAKQCIRWAEEMAVKLQSVVPESVGQTSKEDAPESISLVQASTRKMCHTFSAFY